MTRAAETVVSRGQDSNLLDSLDWHLAEDHRYKPAPDIGVSRRGDKSFYKLQAYIFQVVNQADKLFRKTYSVVLL